MDESQPITSRGTKAEVWLNQQHIKEKKMEHANECQILDKNYTSPKFSSRSCGVSAVIPVAVTGPVISMIFLCNISFT